jgi:hypothetical protein
VESNTEQSEERIVVPFVRNHPQEEQVDARTCVQELRPLQSLALHVERLSQLET